MLTATEQDEAVRDPFTYGEKVAASVIEAGWDQRIRQSARDNWDLCVDEDDGIASGKSCAHQVADLIVAAMAHDRGWIGYDVDEDLEDLMPDACAILETLIATGWLGIPADLKAELEALASG